MPGHVPTIVSTYQAYLNELVGHLKDYIVRKLGERYPWPRKKGYIWARGY